MGPCDSSSVICQELGDQLWFVDLPGVDLLNLRKAAAVMARTNKREMCHRCWSGTGLESPFSGFALPCQLQLTETETETERKCPSVNAMGEQNWPAHEGVK